MIQYNFLNAKLSCSQLNKLKSVIENITAVTLKILLNVVGGSIDKNNFPHKLLITNTLIPKHRKAFVKISSANIKSKTQFYKTGQSSTLLSILLGPLLKTNRKYT